MQAVLLAAGKGSRLFPLTKVVPKPLVKIGGKPIIEYVMDSLDFVSEYIIVIGHLGIKLQQHFGNEYAGVPVKYVEQKELNGTAGALRVARPLIRGNFLVLNADDLYSSKDIRKLAEQPCILVKEVDDVRSYAEIVLDDGVPAKIIEKPANPVSNLANIGAYHFPFRSIEFLDKIPLSIRGEYEITDVVQMCFDRKLLGYLPVTFWCPVGTPAQLFDAHKLLGSLPYIHESSSVQSYGEKVIVYENCVINTHIEDCIVVPNTVLETTDLCVDTVIYKNDD